MVTVSRLIVISIGDRDVFSSVSGESKRFDGNRNNGNEYVGGQK